MALHHPMFLYEFGKSALVIRDQRVAPAASAIAVSSSTPRSLTTVSTPELRTTVL